MDSVSEWIVQIGYLVLFAGLAELVLPDTSVRSAVRLVVGLIVILSVIEPVVRWIGDPGIVDRLTHLVLVDDGRRYVEAGTRLADTSALQVTKAWEESVERQLEAVVALVDGVEGVDADVRVDERGAIVGVEVAVHGSPEGKALAEGDVRRLVQSFVPVLDPSAIDILDR